MISNLTHTDHGHKRILVVDDEEPIRQICLRVLTPLGHQVEIAKSAQEAVQCLEKKEFDLLITDYRMPGELDGLGLAQHTKRQFPKTQLILMTGYPSLENAVTALAIGASDYLVKPFDHAELIDYVNRRHITQTGISKTMDAEILLVDDSKTILILFKGLFEKSGFKVTTANDGETGLRLALQQKPDLVILDGELPRLDGYEVCHRLRMDMQMKHTKIYMFTAGSEAIESKRAKKVGADGFMSKNSAPTDIINSVRKLFSS